MIKMQHKTMSVALTIAHKLGYDVTKAEDESKGNYLLGYSVRHDIKEVELHFGEKPDRDIHIH